MEDRCFINGENIYLRGLEKKDIEGNYRHWFDDIDVCQGNSHHRFVYNNEYLINYVESIYSSNKNLVLAIIHKDDKTHIGNVSLQNINYFNRSSEFAIIIGEKKYWKKGYSKESAKLIINHGFNELNMHRIYCGTYNSNIGMIKLALSLGFEEEGVRREADYKNGIYLDVVEFGLLKTEWNNTI